MMLGSIFKRFFSKPELNGGIRVGYGVEEPMPRMGKSPFSDAIVKTLASIGARSGDIVEVNEHGSARVVGRRLHLASETPDASEQGIREALRRIYGDEAANLDNVMVGGNIVVFRKAAQN
ncbi:hypothetical protein [Paraburkholderia tropica]|uniref:hypothetical protein n=1 Tax=Paraburkholderia tropica TaxID=92647 RepID=UPI002AB61081|nr:hypothetical protein [Paraburkholderia tropica]